jgi:ribosome recycling factor
MRVGADVIDEELLEAEEKMDKAVTVAREDFATIRTGRANPAMFNKINVDYYGSATPINQLASFQAPEARMMIISPYDKGSLSAIEKAIRDSDLGLNPSSDGMIIRVVLPELTEDRRREYIKTARHKAEEAKVAVRNIRRHTMQHLERMSKDGDVGEDEAKRAEKQLDQFTATHVARIEELLKHKEAELLEV